MTKPGYWLLVVSTLFQLAPIVAAIRVRRALTPALTLIAACFFTMFVQDGLMWELGRHGVNNHWVMHAGIPVQTALLLGAFSYWQVTELERLTVRFAIVGFVSAWAVLYGVAEDPTTFSRFTSPLRALLLVAVAAWTLLRRPMHTQTPVGRSDWFWISVGVLAYFATGAVLDPISYMLLPSAPELVRQAFLAKAAFNILVYLAVTRGILCRMPLESSGGFSSPPPSSSSSSARHLSLR